MRLLALASSTCALTLMTTCAHAQSTVTLYGLIDTGISYTNNIKGGSAWQESNGKLGGSRWGILGKEDLGGGLNAIFTLESGFNSANGTSQQGGRLFGRQAFVGIDKTGVGTVTFGRQYDPLGDLIGNYFASGFWTASTHIGDNDNLDRSQRFNNSVKFRSAQIGGFAVDTMYGFSNQASGPNGQGFANNRMWSVAANYTHGPFSFGGGFEQLDHPNSTTNTSGASGGATATTGDDYSSSFFYGIDGGVARQQIAAVGTNYVAGPATVGLGFSHVQLNYNDGAARKLNNYDANLRYQISAPLYLMADYTFTDGRVTGLPGVSSHELRPKWHQVTLGFDYSLSTRTEIYMSASYQKAVGDGSTLVGRKYAAVASIQTAGGVSSTNTQVTVATGIRHKF
ncbi:porin [Burkholderia sp. MR1-5-21]